MDIASLGLPAWGRHFPRSASLASALGNVLHQRPKMDMKKGGPSCCVTWMGLPPLVRAEGRHGVWASRGRRAQTRSVSLLFGVGFRAFLARHCNVESLSLWVVQFHRSGTGFRANSPLDVRVSAVTSGFFPLDRQLTTAPAGWTARCTCIARYLGSSLVFRFLHLRRQAYLTFIDRTT